MQSFNEVLAKWQPFFSTTASVSATLAGLLFVSLSINQSKITASESGILFRLAQRSFSDLLYALFISLMFLIPNPGNHGLGMSLFIVSGFRVWYLIRVFGGAAVYAQRIPGTFRKIREYAFQTISAIGLLVAAFQTYNGAAGAIFFLVPVVALLLYNASTNAWQLLIIERNAEQPPS